MDNANVHPRAHPPDIWSDITLPELENAYADAESGTFKRYPKFYPVLAHYSNGYTNCWGIRLCQPHDVDKTLGH